MNVINAIEIVAKIMPAIPDAIEEDNEEFDISVAQKHFVQNSIKQYSAKPELLITEDEAWKMINED